MIPKLDKEEMATWTTDQVSDQLIAELISTDLSFKYDGIIDELGDLPEAEDRIKYLAGIFKEQYDTMKEEIYTLRMELKKDILSDKKLRIALCGKERPAQHILDMAIENDPRYLDAMRQFRSFRKKYYKIHNFHESFKRRTSMILTVMYAMMHTDSEILMNERVKALLQNKDILETKFTEKHNKMKVN